jgi:hypothetical protein
MAQRPTDIIIAGIGQSNLVRWTVNNRPPRPAPNTFIWEPGSGWATPTGDALITFLNEIARATGRVVRYYPGAVNGVSLLGAGGWVNTAPGQPFDLFCGMVTAARLEPQVYLYLGSEDDSLAAHTRFDGMVLGFRALDDNLNARLGTVSVPFILGVTGLVNKSGNSPVFVKHAELSLFGTGNFKAGPCYYDIPRRDGVHMQFDDPGGAGFDLNRVARRYAQCVLHELGYAKDSGAGPALASARKQGNKILMFATHASGGRFLVPKYDFRYLTGFEVFNSRTGAQITVRRSYLCGPNLIMIEIDPTQDPGLNCFVRYQELDSSDPTNPVYDDLSPGGDNWGRLLQPTWPSITPLTD